jgi:hypothetical protein
MNGVDFYRADNIESRLFEAQAHASGPGKKIDPDRSHWKSPCTQA